MSTVLLVGAGATLADSLPSKPKKSMTPPLDRTFFSLCRAANLEHLPTVVAYMDATYGIDPVRSGAGMEEVFNYLYSDAIGPTSTDESVDAYWALLRMYARAITNTTRNIRGTSRRGVGSVVRYLWNQGERDITIVTFNQDVVIENALEEMTATNKYKGLPWSLDHCYETSFDDFWHTRGEPSFTLGNSASIRVLKLHGSLNWVYRSRSATDARNSLRQPRGAPGLLTQRRIRRQLRARDGGRTVHLLPLIVPPIYEKSGQLRSQLDSVWSAAEAALASCSGLIVFGYSFPPADFAAASLFRRSFVSNTALDEIQVIDPDASVVGRIGSITNAPSIRVFRDTKTFTTRDP